MKIWVNDCEGGNILLELLKMANQSLHESQLRHLENRTLPRQLQQLRFSAGDMNGNSAYGPSVPLGPSVKKRVETILESFFEFGPENDGFGPFFGERQGGSRSRREGYGSDLAEDDGEEELEEDEYSHEAGGARHQQQHQQHAHHYGNGHREGGRTGANATGAVDFDIEDMEDRVSRMNLV